MARTRDEKRLVVDGPRWWRTDPAIAAHALARLKSHVGRGRSGVRTAANDAEPDATRHRTRPAEAGLGERRTQWWEKSSTERRERWESASAEPDGLEDSARQER
jgi:hypothetical protein